MKRSRNDRIIWRLFGLGTNRRTRALDVCRYRQISLVSQNMDLYLSNKYVHYPENIFGFFVPMNVTGCERNDLFVTRKHEATLKFQLPRCQKETEEDTPTVIRDNNVSFPSRMTVERLQMPVEVSFRSKKTQHVSLCSLTSIESNTLCYG